MDTREIVLYLSHLESFPAKLGGAIGCEKALLWFKLYKRFGEMWFAPIAGFGADVGISKSEDLMLDLRFRDLLLSKTEESTKILQYKVNIEKLFELVDHASLDVETPPPFTDPLFLEALNNYIRAMKAKGRSIKKEAVYEQLKNHPCDVCTTALNYSATQGFATLYFDGAYGKPKQPKENASRFHGGGGSNRHAAGGSKVSGNGSSEEGNSFKTRNTTDIPLDF